jgi:hypothetical protein
MIARVVALFIPLFASQCALAQSADANASKLASMYCAASAIRPSDNDPRDVNLQDRQSTAYELHEAELAKSDHPWKQWQVSEIASIGSKKGASLAPEHITNKTAMAQLEERCLSAITIDPQWQVDFPPAGAPPQGYAATKWVKVFQDTDMAVLVDGDFSHITEKSGVRYVTVGFLYSQYRFAKSSDGENLAYSSAVTRVGYRCADHTAASYQTAYFRQTLWHEQFGVSGENLDHRLEPPINGFTQSLLTLLCH